MERISQREEEKRVQALVVQGAEDIEEEQWREESADSAYLSR